LWARFSTLKGNLQDISQVQRKNIGRLFRFVGYLKENIKITDRKPRELRIVGNVDSEYATKRSD